LTIMCKNKRLYDFIAIFVFYKTFGRCKKLYQSYHGDAVEKKTTKTLRRNAGKKLYLLIILHAIDFADL